MYARDVILFDGLELNGLHMHVYKCDRTHVRAIARTYVRLHTRTRTHSIANSTRKRTQTQINACKRLLRLTRGRFLRANAIGFCALDLKLSGCTIYISCMPCWLTLSLFLSSFLSPSLVSHLRCQKRLCPIRRFLHALSKRNWAKGQSK